MGEPISELSELSRTERLVSCFSEDGKLARVAREIPEAYRIMDETELVKLFRPTALDYALKKRLWAKFYDCESTGIYKMKNTDIFGEVCSGPYFYQDVITNPVRVAWLISPPIDTATLVEEAFHYSFQKIRDGVLKLPVTEKTAGHLIKVFQIFADRHLGPVVQRIESKNLNVEVDGNKNADPIDPKAIEEKLNELKTKLVPSRDVTPKDE